MSFPPSVPPPTPLPDPDPVRRGGRPRRGLAAALVVVGCAAAGGGAYALVAGGDDDAGTPEQAVRDYLNAQADDDCERLVDLLSARTLDDGGGRQESLDGCEENRAGVDEEEELSDDELAAVLGSLETTAVDGDRATVTYTAGPELTDELDPLTMEITLVDEGGWKIDDFRPATGALPDDSPQVAARDHAQAILDGDCDAFLAVLSQDALAELGDSPGARSAECERGLGSGSTVTDRRIGPVIRDSERDGRAVVGITIFSESYEAGNNIFYVAVVDEDGTWKVDQLEWSDFPEETKQR